MTRASQGKRLILWDIDGTLLRGGSVAGTAFAAAVETVVGKPAADHGVPFGGKTDPQIVREILAVLDLHDQVDLHAASIIAELERGLAEGRDQMRAEGFVLPGVPELLEALRDAGAIQTVLTGNTAANAAVKIDAFELRPWLDLEVGAFGSDNPDRNQLVPLALERATARYGAVDRRHTWVIGDTPFDAACAQAGGVRCLLVATGHSPRTDLDAADADRVLDDLSATAEVVEYLTAD